MRILAVGAHPDDLEILCAGTLAKYSKLGHEVIMAHVCRGDKGHLLIPPAKLAKIRKKEAEKSAKIINARVSELGIDDLDVYLEREAVIRCVELIRSTKPEVIITHSPDDYMPDHILASKIVFNASFIATLPHTKTKHKFYEKITPVYYMDTLAGANFLPTEYVDITETIEIKKKMLACHSSQLTWLKRHDNIDIIDFMITVAKFRGLQCSVKYAEAFRKIDVWGRNITKRFLP
ncbi:MAG: PIG-L family deacetylase [Elusimicrobiota bacterium]